MSQGRLTLMLAMLLLVSGCDESMDHQNRLKTYGRAANSPSWPAAGEALPRPAGAVAQSDRAHEQAIATAPAVSLALLEEGRLRYDVYCAACHGLTGAGDGIVVARGFPKPSPFDDKRLMQASAAHLVDVIGQGYGRMYSFSDRVEPQQRWAIVAYIRALQLADSRKPAATQ
jgi:mono/diheme cytochrome c family protein